MATALQSLSVTEFEEQYGHEKPYYEFWYGEAIQKSMPSSVHGLLQKIILDLLDKASFKAMSEVKLKIDPSFNPVPDIIATRGRVEVPYPTTAVEVVVEILSDDDPMSRLLTKCRAYQQWGFQQIYVVDPSPRLVFRWSEHRLDEVDMMASRPVSEIWNKLDSELQ
jgi:Uma2 family endonuclease